MSTERDTRTALMATTFLLPEEKIILNNALQDKLPTINEVLMVIGRLAALRAVYSMKDKQ